MSIKAELISLARHADRVVQCSERYVDAMNTIEEAMARKALFSAIYIYQKRRNAALNRLNLDPLEPPEAT